MGPPDIQGTFIFLARQYFLEQRVSHILNDVIFCRRKCANTAADSEHSDRRSQNVDCSRRRGSSVRAQAATVLQYFALKWAASTKHGCLPSLCHPRMPSADFGRNHMTNVSDLSRAQGSRYQRMLSHAGCIVDVIALYSV